MSNHSQTNSGTKSVCHRGRPYLTCRVEQFRTTLSLREGEDADLLTFFSRIPKRKRAEMIKAALKRALENA